MSAPPTPPGASPSTSGAAGGASGAPSTTETDVKTFRDFLYQYNKVTEMCFISCVGDFTSREVNKKEDTCTSHCLDKFLKMTQRMSMRFAEYQLVQSETFGPTQQPNK